MNAAHVRHLLRSVLDLRHDEIGCDTCYAHLDAFAEATLAGRDAASALPLVADHLARCPDCHDEFEALLDALRAIAGMPFL